MLKACTFRATGEDELMLPADFEFTKLFESVEIEAILDRVCRFNTEILQIFRL
jgi:hypothetical protein